MQLLLVKISDDGNNPEYALLGKKQTSDRFTPGDWDKIRSLSRGRRVLLVVPDNDVVLTSITIPSKNRKQLLQAVPYALEDNLAEDIDALHFAVHQTDNDGDTQVAIINRDQLESRLSLLQQHGITSHFVLPQLLTQHIEDNAWSIQNKQLDTDHATVSVRLSNFYGFNCDASLLDLFIDQLDEPLPERILSNIPTQDLPKTLQSLPQEKLDIGLVDYKSAISALPLNLLTGFNRNRGKSAINWKAWRTPLVLASLVLFAWLGITIWQNIFLQSQSRQLSQAIDNTFKQAFPKSRLVDAPQQMAANLAQLKKNAGKTVDSPLPLIADIAPLLKTYKDLSLSEIRYQNDALVLVMQSPNIARLETFIKDAAKKAGLQITIKSSTTTANKVEAELLVSPLDNPVPGKEK